MSCDLNVSRDEAEFLL